MSGVCGDGVEMVCVEMVCVSAVCEVYDVGTHTISHYSHTTSLHTMSTLYSTIYVVTCY